MKKYDNLTKDLALTGPEELWVSDITYIRTAQGFCYLSLITDAYSRKIVGYCVNATLEAAGCVVALKMALNARQHLSEFKLIHHSDHGGQYGSTVNLFTDKTQDQL